MATRIFGTTDGGLTVTSFVTGPDSRMMLQFHAGGEATADLDVAEAALLVNVLRRWVAARRRGGG